MSEETSFVVEDAKYLEKHFRKVGKGWHGILKTPLLLARDKNIPISQVKEKFGRLRIYVDGEDKTLDEAIRLAESASGHICERCGNSGEIRKNSRGWFKTTCDECYEGSMEE